MSLLHCPGGDCTQRHRCLRHTSEILGKQDFFGSPPYRSAAGFCEYFIEDEKLTQRLRECAYLLWLEEGKPEGRAAEHWHEAERWILPHSST
jgi:hypothetical protein